VSLHRDPISAPAQHGRTAQGYLEDTCVINVGLGGRAINLCSRQATAILIEEDVEIVGWASSIGIYALCIHFHYIPSLASGHDEIVSGKVGSRGNVRDLLRISAVYSRVV
jgi:hypothetical protein